MQNAPISLNSYLRVYSQKLPYQKHITCMCHKSNIIPNTDWINVGKSQSKLLSTWMHMSYIKFINNKTS